FAEAKERFEAALAELAPLPDAEAPSLRHEKARVRNSLGQALQQLGRPAEARAALEQARDALRRLAESEGGRDVPEYRQELATTLNNLGDLLRDTDPAAA